MLLLLKLTPLLNKPFELLDLAKFDSLSLIEWVYDWLSTGTKLRKPLNEWECPVLSLLFSLLLVLLVYDLISLILVLCEVFKSVLAILGSILTWFES